MATGLRPHREVHLNFSSIRIGLLGGIGPEATGIFYLKLISKLQASGIVHSNTNFPQIVINSIPAPELLGESNRAELLEPYLKGLAELDKFGVDFIVMICNTIHAYLLLLQTGIRTQILDLKSEVAKEMKAKSLRSALILATPTTIGSGLLEVDSVRYYNLTADELNEVSEAIYKFNSGIEKSKHAERVAEIAQKYMAKGAEASILGCTEISLMLKDCPIKKIDTMDIMVDATMDLMLQKSRSND